MPPQTLISNCTWSTISEIRGDKIMTRLLSLLSVALNRNGRTSLQIDFPYPVGNWKKISLPSKIYFIHAFCWGLGGKCAPWESVREWFLLMSWLSLVYIYRPGFTCHVYEKAELSTGHYTTGHVLWHHKKTDVSQEYPNAVEFQGIHVCVWSALLFLLD